MSTMFPAGKGKFLPSAPSPSHAGPPLQRGLKTSVRRARHGAAMGQRLVSKVLGHACREHTMRLRSLGRLSRWQSRRALCTVSADGRLWDEGTPPSACCWSRWLDSGTPAWAKLRWLCGHSSSPTLCSPAWTLIVWGEGGRKEWLPRTHPTLQPGHMRSH